VTFEKGTFLHTPKTDNSSRAKSFEIISPYHHTGVPLPKFLSSPGSEK